MDSVVWDALLGIIAVLLFIVAGVIQTTVSPWLAARVKSLDVETQKRVALIVVQAVEQMATAEGWTSADKLQHALDGLKPYGFDLTEVQRRQLIEGALREWKELQARLQPAPVIVANARAKVKRDLEAL